ncbi:hypothetical protein ACH492_22080 [Streptomyces sp. NPDC019443]|uniref:hypothetical protein n=1 Tax=Streptomyces sp. NPDC019443 TaxID=3365061 RepID=UPI00379FE40B
MRARTVITALLLAAAATAGCSNAGDAKPTKTVTSTPASPAAAATAATGDLAPIWTPKLDAAAGPNAEATGACQTPSSSECARYIKEIMVVVDGVDAAINKTGKRYPQSTAQIVKMRDAQKVYTDEGCEGDPAADDPNSRCHAIMTITVGPATLGMTLMTDDLTS